MLSNYKEQYKRFSCSNTEKALKTFLETVKQEKAKIKIKDRTIFDSANDNLDVEEIVGDIIDDIYIAKAKLDINEMVSKVIEFTK